MRMLWYLVYCGTIFSGSILMQFFKSYWTSGRFSVKSNIKFVLKSLLKKTLIAIIILAATGAGLFFLLKDDDEKQNHFIHVATATVLILSNVYGMAVLVVLLALGLIKLPIYLWRSGDVYYTLLSLLSNAERVRRAYRTALIEYHEQISICKTLEAQHADGYNRKFFDVLLEEIPDQDLEGQKIGRLKSIGGLEVKKGKKVDEDLIAQVRYKHKLSFFQYQRKRARWQELFLHVDEIVQKPINYNKEQITRRFSKLSLNNSDTTHIDQDKLTLKPIDIKLKRVIIFKFLACLSLLWTLLVISTETALIFGPEYTLIHWIVNSDPDQTIKIFIISVMFLSGITLICLFAIFNLKLSDYL